MKHNETLSFIINLQIPKKSEDLFRISSKHTPPYHPMVGIFQRLVEMRVSMAMEDHTNQSAAKKATNLVLCFQTWLGNNLSNMIANLSYILKKGSSHI